MKNYLTQTLLTCTSVISLYILIQIANLALHQPSVELIALAVRATVDAQPTAKPLVVEIPVTVEVTRLVPMSTEVNLPQPTLEATPTPFPLITIVPTGESVAANSTSSPPIVLLPTPTAVTEALAKADMVSAAAVTCPITSDHSYTLIPMEAVDTSHPDSQHGDLNLALRGYQPSNAAKEFVTYNGAVDPSAPRLRGLFADQRRATISSVHQVRDWRWDCGEHGCPGDWLDNYDVTLMGIATSPGEAISFPKREAEIYGGGYIAVVLYAEATRLTISYTRDGTVAHGYASQLESFCVDPNLLAQYQEGNAGGRHQLPGLHLGDVVGTANSSELLVAIRDRGMFMDPRSELDWWQ